MKIQAVTTFAPRHWDLHAKRCVESFRENCPDIDLMTFDDLQLERDSTWLTAFKAGTEKHPLRRGMVINRYNYKFDAGRFAHKIAAMELAADVATGLADVLLWLDADIVTHSPVRAADFAALLGEADVGYLKRDHKYPECGLVMYRLEGAGQMLIRSIIDHYRRGTIYRLREWHDSFVFEHEVTRMQRAGQIVTASLSGDYSRHSHPFVNGPLGAFMDHCKGPRKFAGKSRRKDLAWNRPEPYWNSRASAAA